MKKLIVLYMALLLLLGLTACGGEQTVPLNTSDAPELKDTVSSSVKEQGGNTQIQFTVQKHPLVIVAEELRLMESNYYKIELSDADAMRFPQLQLALEEYQDTYYQQYLTLLQENATFMDELIAEGYEYAGYENVVLQFTRADEKAFSFSVEDNTYLGGTHGSISYSCVNIDPKTGKDIPLSSVVIHTDGFAQIIYDELFRQSEKLQEYFEVVPSERENLIERLEEGLEKTENFPAWTIGYSGLQINFDDYAMGSYVAGAASVVIGYADYPEYFADEYLCSAESTSEISTQAETLPDAELEIINYEGQLSR